MNAIYIVYQYSYKSMPYFCYFNPFLQHSMPKLNQLLFRVINNVQSYIVQFYKICLHEVVILYLLSLKKINNNRIKLTCTVRLTLSYRL
jgi:hypothetical protein